MKKTARIYFIKPEQNKYFCGGLIYQTYLTTKCEVGCADRCNNHIRSQQKYNSIDSPGIFIDMPEINIEGEYKDGIKD